MVSKEEISSYIKGIVSLVPGSQHLMKLRGTRDTVPADYYYGIWLKHLTLAHENGLQNLPRRVVEFGPGDCFGVGIAALLSGANEYYGLDVLNYTNTDTNLRILYEMVELFKIRAARPHKGWPDFDEFLDERLFPSHILSDNILEQTLNPQRLKDIEEAIKNPKNPHNPIIIKYIVPWMDNDELKDDSIDFCYSHSVLEYVTNLDFLFDKIYRFLKSGAMMSHQIDLSAHNLSDKWNGHWGFSELSWKILTGNRPYFLTRNPYSSFKNAIKHLPFEISADLRKVRNDGLSRQEIAARWKDLSEQDLQTAGMLIQAMK